MSVHIKAIVKPRMKDYVIGNLVLNRTIQYVSLMV